MTHQFKDYVEKCANYCRNELFLGMNRIDIQWAKKARSDDSQDKVTYFDINVNENYYEALLTAYPESFVVWRDGQYKKLGMCILHEVCHILLKPMQAEMMADAAPSQVYPYMGIIERTTQHLAVAFFRLLPQGWWHPSRFGIRVDKKKRV